MDEEEEEEEEENWEEGGGWEDRDRRPDCGGGVVPRPAAHCCRRSSSSYRRDGNVSLPNSFFYVTPKSVLAGTKNSRWERFWLAKHEHKNISTMKEPFPPPAAWF